MSIASTQYRDDWRSAIYNATGDYVKTQRAMELAELNGLFDTVDSQAASVERADKCEGDFYALWCDKCNVHPSKCPLKVERAERLCRYCNGTKRALYFTEQGWTQEWRDCHVCARPDAVAQAPSGAFIQGIREALVEKCVRAVRYCGECDCPKMTADAIRALAIPSALDEHDDSVSAEDVRGILAVPSAQSGGAA